MATQQQHHQQQHRILIQSEGECAIPGFQKLIVNVDAHQIKNATYEQLVQLFIAFSNHSAANTDIKLPTPQQVSMTIFNKLFDEWVALSAVELLSAPTAKVQIVYCNPPPSAPLSNPITQTTTTASSNSNPSTTHNSSYKSYAVSIRDAPTLPPINITLPPQESISDFKEYIIDALSSVSTVALDHNAFELLYFFEDFEEYVCPQTMEELTNATKLQLCNSLTNESSIAKTNDASRKYRREGEPEALPFSESSISLTPELSTQLKKALRTLKNKARSDRRRVRQTMLSNDVKEVKKELAKKTGPAVVKYALPQQ